mmetsp:Transcript_20014/g.68936  ORF Transcript_20014/g.68936 Transcript_20014/m.68936 type:complete len:351 (-) Transcript_20014:1475-2527(-)
MSTSRRFNGCGAAPTLRRSDAQGRGVSFGHLKYCSTNRSRRRRGVRASLALVALDGLEQGFAEEVDLLRPAALQHLLVEDPKLPAEARRGGLGLAPRAQALVQLDVVALDVDPGVERVLAVVRRGGAVCASRPVLLVAGRRGAVYALRPVLGCCGARGVAFGKALLPDVISDVVEQRGSEPVELLLAENLREEAVVGGGLFDCDEAHEPLAEDVKRLARARGGGGGGTPGAHAVVEVSVVAREVAAGLEGARTAAAVEEVEERVLRKAPAADDTVGVEAHGGACAPRHDAVRGVVLGLPLAPAVRLVDGALHGLGDLAAVGVARGAADGLDERRRAAEETLLLGAEDSYE